MRNEITIREFLEYIKDLPLDSKIMIKGKYNIFIDFDLIKEHEDVVCNLGHCHGTQSLVIIDIR